MFIVVQDIQLSKNFKLSEFVCHDKDNNKVLVYMNLIEQLQKFRDKLTKLYGKDMPITVISGYRTPEHNADPKVGGAKNSLHLVGKAADIRVKGIELKELARLAAQLFDGIGIYPKNADREGFVHVDVRGFKARWRG